VNTTKPALQDAAGITVNLACRDRLTWRRFTTYLSSSPCFSTCLHLKHSEPIPFFMVLVYHPAVGRLILPPRALVARLFVPGILENTLQAAYAWLTGRTRAAAWNCNHFPGDSTTPYLKPPPRYARRARLWACYRQATAIRQPTNTLFKRLNSLRTLRGGTFMDTQAKVPFFMLPTWRCRSTWDWFRRGQRRQHA